MKIVGVDLLQANRDHSYKRLVNKQSPPIPGEQRRLAGGNICLLLKPVQTARGNGLLFYLRTSNGYVT